jgi:hypothetical protein
MIIDCREASWIASFPENRKRVLVDGVEIRQVFYVDTDAGFVRTYDVLGDAQAHATREMIEANIIAAARDKDYAGSNSEPWDMPLDGVMSKYVRGVVELHQWE